MKKIWQSLMCIVLVALQGCAKPNLVVTFKGPGNVFYTVETFNGSGPVDPDFIRVYANLQLNGKSDRALVLDGGYLTVPYIGWSNPSEVKICVKGGSIHEFHQEVKLSAGGEEKIIYNRITSICKK